MESTVAICLIKYRGEVYVLGGNEDGAILAWKDEGYAVSAFKPHKDEISVGQILALGEQSPSIILIPADTLWLDEHLLSNPVRVLSVASLFNYPRKLYSTRPEAVKLWDEGVKPVE